MPESPIILVADDDPVIRMASSEMLHDNGYQPLTAGSADEALAILTYRHDVAALLTDVFMPGTLDGLGLATLVRRRWPHMRVVLTSGRAPAAAVNGADIAFLAKPFAEHQLMAALRAGAPSPA